MNVVLMTNMYCGTQLPTNLRSFLAIRLSQSSLLSQIFLRILLLLALFLIFKDLGMTVIDDYKLIRYVCFVYDVHNSPLEQNLVDSLTGDTSFDSLWEIYSLRSNSWRKP